MEILKVLFNITFDSIKKEVEEEDAALYRYLGTLLRHCLMVAAAGDRTEEFHGHAVNLLGNLPLKCLDVLLTLELHEGSLEFMGVNMDVIGVLLAFLEKRLHQLTDTHLRLWPSADSLQHGLFESLCQDLLLHVCGPHPAPRQVPSPSDRPLCRPTG
jgi:hypothetical protein